MREQRRARLGEPKALARAALDERQVELVLQLADALGHRRLADPQALGRAREAARLGHGDEQAHQVQVEGHNLTSCIGEVYVFDSWGVDS
ncbi:hypothetical protein D9M68_936490 [compost metagenome]